jgi:preprotein translocase subunit SecE
VAVTLAELRKVVWPSRQQLFSESVAVILMVSLSAAAIAEIDRFYHWGSTQIFR